MKMLLAIAAWCGVIALMCIGFGGDRAGAMNVIGSTSVQPFAEMLAEEYNRGRPGYIVDVQGGGSTAGLQAAEQNLADIGMCSRALKQEEAEHFQEVVIARDGLAVVVHPSSPVSSLTREQIQRIFSGEIRNWNEVGGPDHGICLITREEGSGTREAFTKLVMGKARIARQALTQESNGAVQELVKHDPSAIGYMSLGLVGAGLKSLQVAGVAATAEEVVGGRYPLVRPFLFVTKGPPSPNARKFIAYVKSPEAQRLLQKEGLVAAP